MSYRFYRSPLSCLSKSSTDKCTELESGGSGQTEVYTLKFTNDPSAGSPTEQFHFGFDTIMQFHKLISQLSQRVRPYLKQELRFSPTIIWPVNSIHTPKRLGLGCGLPISLVRDHTLNFYYTQGYQLGHNLRFRDCLVSKSLGFSRNLTVWPRV